MTTILHISDTHFGTEVDAVVKALLESAANLRPDVVILSGDITQRARKNQFKSAVDFMASLGVRAQLIIPGNHDIPLFNPFVRFLTPYHNYSRAFGARQSLWINEDVVILGYDATSPWRHTQGKLHEKQIRALVKELEQRAPGDVLRIACAHQPLVTAWVDDKHETLIERDRTAELWSKANIDLALSGHVHVPLLTTTRARFPQLPRHFILAGAGTATSHRIRVGAPNSFNVIQTERGQTQKRFSITHHAYDSTQQRFAAGHAMRFVQASDGWKEEEIAD